MVQAFKFVIEGYSIDKTMVWGDVAYMKLYFVISLRILVSPTFAEKVRLTIGYVFSRHSYSFC